MLLLVTDLGFIKEYGHVWHMLSDIDDSGEFLDASFCSLPVSVPTTAPLANDETPAKTGTLAILPILLLPYMCHVIRYHRCRNFPF